MLVNGKHYRSIWYDGASDTVQIIDQTRLPHHFEIATLNSLKDAAEAIRSMRVRGAPLIGITALYGLYLALRDEPGCRERAINTLLGTRPTAVNLAWALAQAERHLAPLDREQQVGAALLLAEKLADQDVANCEAIGRHGSQVLEKLWRDKADHSTPLQVLTHCNAGWLATVDWGTALAVLYKTRDARIPLHVWVDETRPRNQGAALTTWELAHQGIDHTLIVDNTGGYLMQKGMVDVCVVGSDRTTVNGDVCNKIGTYLKALAARDNHIPFYVALPVSSIDFSVSEGLSDIPIEQRDPAEVSRIAGLDSRGQMVSVNLAPAGTKAVNYGFDITPARLVSGLVTEKGVCPADRQHILALQDAPEP